MSDCTRMGYEWSFGAAPKVNGSAIKDIRINGRLPDAVYCDGKLVGKVKKDVSVTFYKNCIRYSGESGECYHEAEYDSCGFITSEAYTDTTYKINVYAMISVSQGSETSGKRIRSINWYVSQMGVSASGTIDWPESRTYYCLAGSFWNDSGIFVSRRRIDVHIYYTDGDVLKAQLKDSSKHSRNPPAGFYSGNIYSYDTSQTQTRRK